MIDTTLPLPAQIQAIQAHVILKAQLCVKIAELEKKRGIWIWIGGLPNKIKYCCSITSDPSQKDTHGKYS